MLESEVTSAPLCIRQIKVTVQRVKECVVDMDCLLDNQIDSHSKQRGQDSTQPSTRDHNR
jgi:hypothetical protein